MDIFLEVATPEDLCKHLFLSFVRVPQTANIDGKTLKVYLLLDVESSVICHSVPLVLITPTKSSMDFFTLIMQVNVEQARIS